MPRTRSSSFELSVKCRVCGGEHTVRGTAELLRQPIVFGGGAVTRPTASTQAWTMPLNCPLEQRTFEAELLIPTEYNESVQQVQIVTIRDTADGHADEPQPAPVPASAKAPGEEPLHENGPPRDDWIDEELKDWRKLTVPTLRSFATTMLTTSSGGVAVYFAVLKYLGWEQARFGTALVALSVTPPVLLFAAAVAFALALRPSLAIVERNDYAEFRARRIVQMQQRATLGIVCYAGALLLALVTFVLVLAKS